MKLSWKILADFVKTKKRNAPPTFKRSAAQKYGRGFMPRP